MADEDKSGSDIDPRNEDGRSMAARRFRRQGNPHGMPKQAGVNDRGALIIPVFSGRKGNCPPQLANGLLWVPASWDQRLRKDALSRPAKWISAPVLQWPAHAARLVREK